MVAFALHSPIPFGVGYRRRTVDSTPTEHAVEASSDDRRLLAALRAGDERAFAELLRLYGPSMLRVARLYVGSRAVAEEVVQEAWLGVIKGLARFEGRSSLKTWIFRILTNIAKTRGEREGRTIPFSAFAGEEDGEPAVDPERFLRGGESDGHWLRGSAPVAVPEASLLAAEARRRIDAAIEALPESQRTVITLRDVNGFSSEEVRDLLDLSEVNQRVLLHRARSKVRAAFEEYLEEAPA